MLKKRYGKPVDIWAVGTLTYEVLTSKPLYPGESDLDQLSIIMNSLGIYLFIRSQFKIFFIFFKSFFNFCRRLARLDESHV